MTKIMMAHLHEHRVSHSWYESQQAVLLHELGRGNEVYLRSQRGVNGVLGESRNLVVEKFLSTEAEYLFWSDTDMGYAPDTIERLLAHETGVVGGLYFGQTSHVPDGMGGYRLATFPLIFLLEDKAFLPAFDYPRNQVVQCDGTGSGIILIHRSVFEAIDGDWYSPYPTSPKCSEDLAFCLRLKALEIPLYIDTSVKATHHKDVWLSEELYDFSKPAKIVEADK